MPRLPERESFPISDWFTAHLHHPYPTEADYQQLSEQTGVGEKRIYNIVAQKRKRLRQQTREAFLSYVSRTATIDASGQIQMAVPPAGSEAEFTILMVLAEHYLWQTSDKPHPPIDSRYIEYYAHILGQKDMPKLPAVTTGTR